MKKTKQIKLFPYAGSKHKYKSQIQNVIAQMQVKEVDTYIEPFAGSLGSFFHIITKIKAKRIIINDINVKLTNIYQQIKENPAQVAKAFKNLEEHFQALLPKSIKSGLVKKDDRELMEDARDFYMWVRDYINQAPLTPNHAAAMIFVLNHNFNGLYQENKKGHFNVSFNWNARRIDYKAIIDLIGRMHRFFVSKNIEIETMDVFDLLSKHSDPNTFIYLDPPYIDNTITYVANGFDISLPNQMKLLYMTLKYENVMYSNHHSVHFAGFFDKYINFHRTNKISSSFKEQKTKEFLGYRINQTPAVANNTSKPTVDTDSKGA